MDATEQRTAVDVYRLLVGQGPMAFDDLAQATELSRERVEAALDSWSGVAFCLESGVVGWSFLLNSAFLSVLLDRALIGLPLWVTAVSLIVFRRSQRGSPLWFRW
jgi:hypothetical protein